MIDIVAVIGAWIVTVSISELIAYFSMSKDYKFAFLIATGASLVGAGILIILDTLGVV